MDVLLTAVLPHDQQGATPQKHVRLCKSLVDGSLCLPRSLTSLNICLCCVFGFWVSLWCILVSWICILDIFGKIKLMMTLRDSDEVSAELSDWVTASALWNQCRRLAVKHQWLQPSQYFSENSERSEHPYYRFVWFYRFEALMLITVFSVLSGEKFKVPILFISGSDESVNYSTLGVCAPSLSLLTCFPPLPFPVKLPSRSAGIKARELVTSSRRFITFPHSFLLSSVGLYYRLSSLRLIWHVRLSWRTFIGKSKEPGDKNKAHEAGRVDHQAFL